ncbi:NADP-dependent oxidoreductase [Horticoccus luteus]|uniref:NADP-dependent oxidoreductase n=1 Tax=Horticoccus luteus TaxID=2862869 RepID=A0A8F9TV83_9BACT|nr:NADP-dependent oxidoreductase [Horticoccus luteus]QYM78393.1 NADP-dependent oxidoreductase [Horticoccus luteus]
MNAVIFRSFGGPDVLESAHLPRPEPQAGEVLIRVHAASVNPIDYKIRSGHFHRASITLPAVLGRDVAGTIADVGAGITDLAPGDEVYAFLGSHSGGYAQFALARANEVARKPRSLDYIQAAAVPLAATTAWQGLFDHGRLQAGQRVLIHGAGGGVGHFAVQFAKAKGATVIATVSPEDVDLVQTLGADEVIDYKAQRFEDRTAHIDLVFDLIGGDTQTRSWAVLKNGGTLVSTLQQPSVEEARKHHAHVSVFMAEPRREQLVAIAKLIDAGKVCVAVSHTHSLFDAREAHDELEHEHSTGKLVLTVA